MKFKNLTQDDKNLIKQVYQEESSRYKAQEKLANHFKVTRRCIRKWANALEQGVLAKNITTPSNILIYDIETGRIPALVWWTGKQYVGHEQLQGEAKIISISFKWLGDDKVHALTWDKYHSDEEMMKEFLKSYNKADMVIGVNNDRFDNRWINARAAKHRLNVNTFVRSFDVQKEMKRLFRLPSYAMKYVAKYFGLELKMEHVGIEMWNKIQFGTPEEQKEYLQLMVDYNVQDIVVTEDIYLQLRKYMGHKTHFGVLHGEEKFTCPNCGSYNVHMESTTVTPAGTVQRIMRCKEDEVPYRLTNKLYMDYLQWKSKNIE